MIAATEVPAGEDLHSTLFSSMVPGLHCRAPKIALFIRQNGDEPMEKQKGYPVFRQTMVFVRGNPFPYEIAIYIYIHSSLETMVDYRIYYALGSPIGACLSVNIRGTKLGKVNGFTNISIAIYI